MITAPASRSRRTTNASDDGVKPSRASEPPVVGMPAVSMLSFTATGMPCSVPLEPEAARSASRAAASSRAAGLTTMKAFRAGPARSYAAMRAR